MPAETWDLTRKAVLVRMEGALRSGATEAYADALVELNRHYASGKASVVTPTVRQRKGADPIDFEQFAREHADTLR